MRSIHGLYEAGLLAVCLVWGFIGPVVKICSSDIQPIVLAVLRYLFSVIICIIVLVMLLGFVRRGSAILEYISHYSFLRLGKYALPNIVVSVIASIFGFGISIPAFFEAVKIAGVYLTYVIGISLSVIIVSLARSLLGQELLTKYKIMYCTLLVLLCMFTIALSRPAIVQIMYILLFAVPWGLYTVLISFINRPFRGVCEVIQTTLIDVLVATIIGTVSVMLIFGVSKSLISRGIIRLMSNVRDFVLVVIFLSLTATVLAYIATYVIVSLKPETVVLLSIFQFIEVIQGILIGVLYFHEVVASGITIILYLAMSIVALSACSWLRQVEVRRGLRRVSS